MVERQGQVGRCHVFPMQLSAFLAISLELQLCDSNTKEELKPHFCFVRLLMWS